MRTVASVVVLGLVALMAACVVTDVGNPPDARAQVSVSFLIQDQEAPFIVEQAWLVASSVRLIEAPGCDVAAAPVRLNGPVVLSQRGAAVSTPMSFEALVEPGYCKLGFVLSTAPVEPATDEPGVSLFVEAKRRSDDQRVLIKAPLTQRMGLSAPTGSPLQVDSSGTSFVVVLDASTWFDSDALDQLSPQANGDVVIGPEQAASLYAPFVDALGQGVRLVRDADGDGQLSEAELDVSVAEGGLEAVQ